MKKYKNMKKIGCILMLMVGLVMMTTAQTYLKPKYAARALKEVEITKIEITDKYTIVSFHFESEGGTFELGGWIALDKNMYIKNALTHKKYYLIKAHNIPILPQRIDFQGKYSRSFKAYFPPISPATKTMHIIEEATNGFNFYKIRLKPLA